MGETNKQVRVDNWGIFFLQRLQLFFNKTDYCDLTLQFEGNVQLKVHRLVMNACTEYFNVLEQTCEVIDGNTVIMPQDLQADVILPIVNFMYTGMLEFQMSIFDKLYHTAELMNIPVLTKLLDAQKKPIAPLPKLINKKLSSTWNLQGKKITPKIESDLPMTLPGRKLPVWKRKMVPNRSPHTSVQHFYSEVKSHDPLSNDNTLSSYDNTPKPTRFEWPEDEISSTFNMMDNSFDDISYTSKPLLTQDDELRASTSFDDMKHQTLPNKKSKEYGNQSIDMEEVKNYVKEQKIRSDINDYDDEDDPDTYLDSYNPGVVCKRKLEKSVSVGSKRVRFSVSEKENKETKINITPAGKASDVNHTKIISEVLKKYPHLVKKNKNIRLKILAKSPTKSELQKAQMLKTIPTSKLRVQVSSPKGSPKPIKLNEPPKTNNDEGPWTCSKCSTDDEQVEFVLYYLYRKHMTDVHNEKFDSRMCKFCGHQSSKHNMLMYHQYTRHGIKPPAAYNFPKCNRCPYIALTENLLIKHKLNHTKFDLQCIECKVAFNSQVSLSSHMQITGHSIKSGRNSYDCQYCTKRYQTGSNLFSHIKLLHRDEARRDGIVSIDESEAVDEDQDDNDIENDSEEYILPELDSKEKVKIISNIKVPPTESEIEHTPEAEMEESTDSINNMATSLGLVDIVVLENDQQFILHNDQQLVAAQQSLTNNQPEYILPEISDQHSFSQSQTMTEVITSEHNVITQSMLNNSDIASTDELVMVLTDHDYNDGGSEILTNDNSNIVVLYSHPVDGQQNQFITSQGNLMLNSETGMLEIRNDTPSSAPQETQIESIELIQREINSHNDLSNQQQTKDNMVVSTDTNSMSTNVEPMMQNTDILENQSGDDSIQVMDRREDAENIKNESELIHTEMREETVETMSEDGDDVKVEEVPMEIDEDCGVFESNEDKNEQNSIVETIVMIDTHNDEITSETADTCEETRAEQPQSKTSVDVENSITTIVESASETELVSIETKVEVDKTIKKCIDADLETEKNTNEESSNDDTPTQELAEVNVEDEDTAESDTLAHEKGIQPQIALELLEPADCEHHDSVGDSEKQESDVLEKLDDSNNLKFDDSQGLHIEDDQQNTEEHECEVQTEIVDSLNQAGIDETTKANETSQSDNVPSIAADIENEGVKGDKELDKCAESPDGDAQNKSDETQNVEVSLSKTETETEDKIIVDTNIQCDDKATSDKDCSEAITDNVEPPSEAYQAEDEVDVQDISQNESLVMEEEMEVEDSESMDDDNSQSQDSQMSRSSQNSNSSKVDASINVSKSGLGKDSSQSTKISILDDWEDTEEDSQQSDIARRKAERTVHKLIDDWDDDEEDDDEDDDDEGQT